jgi:outer membrane protein insertion porin family
MIENLYRHILSYLHGTIRKMHPLSILLLLGLFSSCKIDKYLGENEHIVAANKIKIENIENRRARVALEADLTTLYKQKDLPDILIGKSKSSAWWWFKFNEKDLQKDTLHGFKKWFYKSFATQPTLYDSSASAATVRIMEQYLRNVGYLHPKVVADHDYRNKKANKGLADITYTVYPRTLYIIDTTYFVCKDTKIQYLLNDLSTNTLLARGKSLDLRLFEQEKQRITTALNNSGYAAFTPNYFSQLGADTTWQKSRKNHDSVRLTLTVKTPNETGAHQKYKIGRISVYPAFEAIRGDSTSTDTLIFDKKHFITEGGQFGLKVGTLSNAIPLKQDSVFSKEKNDQTIRQLTNLGIYKFVNIKPIFDEKDTTAVSYKIYLTPQDKMSYDGGVELNYSNINLSNGASRLGRLGLATDLGFTHRNLFGGAEHFTSRFSAGLDRSLSFNKNSPLKNGFSFDIRFENTLSIPKFINFSNSWLLFSKLHIIKASFYKDLKENAKSDLTSSYVFSDRLFLDLYRLQQFNLGTRYVLKRKNGSEQFVINPTGVEVQLSKLTENFNNLADERLRRSLNTQLMTGFIARSLTHERSSKTNAIGERWQFLTHIEQSGLEILGLEQLFNKGNAFKLTNELSFSKFLRGEVDVRYNRQLTANRFFAGRLSLGIAKSLDNAPVPYSRQFSVGGPNSIRGWVIRDIFHAILHRQKRFLFKRVISNWNLIRSIVFRFFGVCTALFCSMRAIFGI